MNQVFKVVFSEVCGMFVVGSELIKSHGKSKAQKTAVALAAVALMGMAGYAGAEELGPFIGTGNIEGYMNLTKDAGTGNITSTAETTGNGTYAIAFQAYSGNATLKGNEIELSAKGDRVWTIYGENGNASVDGKTINIKSEGKSDGYTGIGVLATGTGATVSLKGDTVNISSSGAGDVYGLFSPEGGVIDVTGATTITAKTSGADPLSAFGIWAHKGGTVTVNGESLNIEADGGDARGIHVQNNSVNATSGFAKVTINSTNTTVKSSNIGISAMSQGQVYVDSNLTLDAPKAILARGDAVVHINENSDRTVRMDGDIVFDYDKATSGTKVDADVLVNLTGSESYWDGNAKVEWGTGKPDDASKLDVDSLKVSLSDGATWNPTVVEDKEGTNGQKGLAVNELTLNDGVINVNNGEKQTVNVGQLKGSGGTINIKTSTADDGETYNAGYFNAASAEGALEVNYTGITSDDVKDKDSAAVALAKHVKVTGASQSAKIAEGDVGGEITWTVEAGSDDPANVTEKRNSVIAALHNIAANNFLVFRSQMNDLDKRMGDLRTMPKADGLWARVIAGQSEYKNIHNTYQTLQIGADHRIDNFFGGVMASYTDGDGSLKNGDTDDKNYSLGLYGGWLGDDGQFVDVTLKRHHAESDYDLRYLNGERAKGSYNTSGTSISAEYGWRLGIANTNYYVEPQVEFMYGHLNSVGYKTSNGVKISQDAIKTAVGRLGVAAGWVSPDKTGSVYVKASVLNDWEGDAKIKARKGDARRSYTEDMGGTWGEFALGGTWNITKNLSAYGEMETTAGNPVRTTYQFSAGMRYSF